MQTIDTNDKSRWVLTFNADPEKRIYIVGKDALLNFMENIDPSERSRWSLWGEEFAEPRLVSDFDPHWEAFCGEDSRSLYLNDFSEGSEEPTLSVLMPDLTPKVVEHSAYDRRVHKRISAQIPIKIQVDGNELMVLSKSISAGGLCLDEKLSQSLKGKSCTIGISTPEITEEIYFHATIRDIESFGTLVIFDGYQAEKEVETLKNWVETRDCHHESASV